MKCEFGSTVRGGPWAAGGGCGWIPRHIPPGLCLDVRARRQQREPGGAEFALTLLGVRDVSLGDIAVLQE